MYDHTGDMDVIPVRDHNAGSNKRHHDAGEGMRVDASQKASQQRRMVSKWQREELEDKYLRQYEENIVLKKHARKQEDKIKRMATKLLRLIGDKKKQDAHAPGATKGKMRDIETEEMLEELHGKVRELEKENHMYKEKLMLAKQQLLTQGSRKSSAYGMVPARIDTGVPKTMPHQQSDPRISKSMRVTGPPPPQASHRTVAAPGLPRYGHSLLEEARGENKHLEQIIEQQNEQINQYEQDIELLKEQMQVREVEFEEDLLKLKQQMSQGQRTAIQENIDVIRLQREVKEKSSKLIQLQTQYQNLEDKLHGTKGTHDQVLMEMENLNEQLKHEQNRSLTLQNELKSGTSQQRNIHELQSQITDLENECQILKEANERLVSSAFDMERDNEWRQKVNALKVQVAQLEATLRADVGEKGNVLDKLTEERESHERLEEEHKALRIQSFEVQQERDSLRDKLRFFSRDGALDTDEMEEALTLVKARRQNQQSGVDLDFLHKVDEEKGKDSSRRIRELQAEHADTINELEKTRNMLIVQHKINKDYSTEAESVTAKMEDLKAEYDDKLEEYAQLLDIRAARIRKLESQLRDVAYGTRQYRVHPGGEDGMEDMESDAADSDLDDSITLERGQNLFEIHVKRVLLSPEALKLMNDEEPSVFCTWEFFDYEVQATPVMKGPHPAYKFTSQYVVKVDDFFLHYLQKDSCTLELHQSFGTDYRTMAACQLKMRDILDRSHTRVSSTVQLIGRESGLALGTVEYWVRLRVPMEQALRLYKERSKALGYLHTDARQTQESLHALDSDADARRITDNVNELRIKVASCSNVHARREGVQPSPYCVYKFFDFADHDTPIVVGSNDPQYNDAKVYPVAMTADLDKFLKQQPLQIFVFDDTDPEEGSYLGVAKVPLIPLAHDKPIRGTFELYTEDGRQNGTIDVSFKWRFSYIPPRGAARSAAQGGEEGADGLHLLPGEQEALHPTPPRTPKGRSKPPRGPSGGSIRRKSPPPSEPDPDMLQPVPHAQIQHPSHSEPPQEDEGSVVSEGTPVPGESDALSTDEDVEEEDALPPARGSQPSAPQVDQQDDSMDVTLTESGDNHNSTQDEEKGAEQLVAEELEQTNAPPSAEDTMFEAQDAIEEGESESEIEEDEDIEKETGGETEDSEVVMGSPTSRPQSQLGTSHPGDNVTISVAHLSFHPDAPLHDDDEVKKLFVEYRFLDVLPEQTETPYALPKAPPGESLFFNFTKVFRVDFDSHIDRRRMLASRLLPDDGDEGRLRFTVVAEPDDDQSDCQDVGVAFVSLPQILEEGRDVVEEDVPIYDMDDQGTEIGTMNLTVKCVDALQAVQVEMASVGPDYESEREE